MAHTPPDHHNVEAWLLDQAEGRLNQEQTALLRVFLEQNPNYQPLHTDDLQLTSCIPADDLSCFYLESEDLKKYEPAPAELQQLFNYAENPALDPLPEALRIALTHDQILRKHLHAYRSARLAADPLLILDHTTKRTLRKKRHFANISPQILRVAAAAVIAVLLSGVLFMRQVDPAVTAHQDDQTPSSEHTDNSVGSLSATDKSPDDASAGLHAANEPAAAPISGVKIQKVRKMNSSATAITAKAPPEINTGPAEVNPIDETSGHYEITAVAMPYAISHKKTQITTCTPTYVTRIETTPPGTSKPATNGKVTTAVDRILTTGDRVVAYSQHSLQLIGAEGFIGLQSSRDNDGDINALSLRLGLVELSQQISKNSLINKL